MTDLKGKTVIVRGINSGVYIGELVDRQGQEVELANVQNIWRWQGAVNLTELADKGLDENNYTRITEPVNSVVFTDICEIIPCSEIAIQKLRGHKIWKYQK